MKRILFLSGLFFLFFSLSFGSGNKKSSVLYNKANQQEAASEVLNITLEGSIGIALENNLEIKT